MPCPYRAQYPVLFIAPLRRQTAEAVCRLFIPLFLHIIFAPSSIQILLAISIAYCLSIVANLLGIALAKPPVTANLPKN
jgi:hypothetical protein